MEECAQGHEISIHINLTDLGLLASEENPIEDMRVKKFQTLKNTISMEIYIIARDSRITKSWRNLNR